MNCPGCNKRVKKTLEKCPDCDAKLHEEEEPTEALAEGEVIDGDDLAPVIESAQLVVPKKGGIFQEKVVEGHKVKVGKFAIIRPCQSKGRRIRGHAPIYEPRMLAENASVFTGWPMYLDHVSEELAEELAELLQEAGRSMKDLGGRIINSFYDPDLTFKDDKDFGYQKGGVVGEVIPQKLIREMLEEDPGALNVSINAWPKGVRIGSASWDSGVKGALIEGIRSKPMGSVDFVFRGGAGGRPLSEEDRRSAVSLLESCLTSDRDDGHPPKEPAVKKKLSEMSAEEVASLTREQLHEALKAENPSLAESLSESPAPSGDGGGSGDGAPLTEERVSQMLTEQREALVEEFKGEQLTEEEIEERAEQIVQERESLRSLAEHAESEISELERNGLPAEYGKEIRKNYLLLPSGPRSGLLVEEREGEDGTMTKEEVLTEQIKEDARVSVRLIEAAGGTARVRGLGASSSDDGGSGDGGQTAATLKEGDAFTDFLVESGDITGDAEKDKQRLSEIVGGN